MTHRPFQHRVGDGSSDNLSYRSLCRTISGYPVSGSLWMVSHTLIFVALSRRRVVSSWECLKSTPAATAVILYWSHNLEYENNAAVAVSNKYKKQMVGSEKYPVEEKSTSGLRLYQEYQQKESERAASAANSSASRYST